MDPFTIILLFTGFCLSIGGIGGTIYHYTNPEQIKKDKKIQEQYRKNCLHSSALICGRRKRDVGKEHGNDDVIQFLRAKCVDKAPNCEQKLCQNHHISLWKKCKKTCGVCNPMKN